MKVAVEEVEGCSRPAVRRRAWMVCRWRGVVQ